MKTKLYYGKLFTATDLPLGIEKDGTERYKIICETSEGDSICWTCRVWNDGEAKNFRVQPWDEPETMDAEDYEIAVRLIIKHAKKLGK